MKGITTIVLFVAALLLSGAAAYFANDYIEGAIAEKQSELDRRYQNVDVIVALTDLPAGVLLTSKTVSKRPLPRKFVPADAVLASEFQSIAGALLTIAMRAGDPVLRGYLATSPQAGFSATLPEGMRALTFPVNDESSIGGFLAPGDRIDLLYTASNGQESVTVPLLYAVPIIATGIETAANARLVDGNDEPGGYRTVTVSVTPEDAAKITMARGSGELTVALRKSEDETPLQLTAVTKRTLLYGSQPKGPAKPRNRIDVILGGQ